MSSNCFSAASGKDAPIPAEDAEKQFEEKYNYFREGVVRHAEENGYDWAPHQIDALTSFSYNLGLGNLNKLTEEGTRGDQEISEMILEYNKAGGKPLKGLTKRRQAEAKLFTQGYDS